MSALRDWNEIKELLESDKIKQRAEGISRCREFLSSKRNFKAFNENRNYSWLETLQTLFHIVIIERNASVSKKTAATDRRLDEAAQMVRWIAEKVHRLLSRKVAKALINHLTQMMAVNGKVQSFALTYAKALRTVLSYPPHLEHLDERQWTDITMLCFSATLGDKVKIGQDFADSEAMDVDEDDSRPGGALRADSDDEFALPTAPKRSAGPLEIELVGCLEVVFRSNSSPFVTYAQAIFRKFLRFFRVFPVETTAHLPALVALNRALSELDLNDQSSMRRLGPHLWTPILALWSTKNAFLKEQVIISLRYLFPFVIPYQHPHRSTNEPTVTARAKELYDAVLTEPLIRWRESYSLDLDHLAVGLREDEDGERKAFDGKTFRLGSGFDEKDAVAWSVAELGADALARIYEVTDATEGRDEAGLSDNARGKRRKIEDPLSLLLESITDITQPTAVSISRLQILLFLVDRNWQSLDNEASRRILSTSTQLLSSTVDSQIQSWNLLVIGAIARNGLLSCETTESTDQREKTNRQKKNGGNIPAETWDQIWTLVLRKVAIVETCRPACHAANILLAHDRASSPVVVEAVETFVRDLEIQGPNFPSDSVCLFLEWCLAISASDGRLFRLHFSDKLVSWLTSSWRPLEGVSRSHSFGQARPHADPLSPSGLVLLVARLTHSPVMPTFIQPTYVPDCAVGSQALDLCETARVRDFIEARVPPYHRKTSGWRTPSSLSATGGATSEETEQIRQRRLSAWLAKTLEGFIQDGEVGGETHWTNMSLELARRHLDLATITLSVEGLLSLGSLSSSSNRPQSPAVRNANSIITRLAPTLALRKWRPAERAHLLQGLDLVFAPIKQLVDIEYPVFLEAGPASDIPQSALSSSPLSESRPRIESGSDFESPRFILLRTIWKIPNTRESFEEIVSALRFILGAVTQTESSPTSTSNGTMSQTPSTQASQRLKEIESTQKKDEFDDIKVSNRTAQSLGPSMTARRAAQAYMSMTIRGFVSAEMALSGSNGSVRLTEVVEAITSSEGEDGLIVAEQVLKAIRSGLVSLGLAQCDSILTYLGNDLLPDYRYARDERFHLVALRFLYCVSTTWIKAEGPTEEFGTLARQLCAFYINALRKTVLASWRIRLQLMALFDEYLRVDPSLHYWKVGNVLVVSDGGMIISPNNIIPFMLADSDFRVRFRASSSAPRLFQVYHEIGIAGQPLFEDIKSHLTFNLTETEQVLTQVLAHANIMIASAARRRGPYDLLLDIAAKNPDLRESTIASLTAVSERLGLPSLSSLYLEYARCIVWVPMKNLNGLPEGEQVGSDFLQQLQFRAAGFANLRDARRADFKRTASWLLQSEHTEEAFKTLCATVKISPQAGRLACLAETVALVIIRHQVLLYYDPKIPVDTLRTQLNLLAEGAGAGDAHLAEKLLSSIADNVVTETLAETFEQRWRHDQLLPALETHDKVAAETFHDILQLSEDFTFGHEPPPPFYSSNQTVAAAVLFSKDYSVFNKPAAVFSIVFNFLAKVRSAQFVLQKQRRLLSLSLALALSHRCVNETSILGALGRGLVDLLPQIDLLPLVIPMLRWSIERWFSDVTANESEHPDHRALSDLLIRAAHASEQLRQAFDSDPRIESFANFLDDALRRLCGLREETATEACILWPRDIVETSTFAPSEVYAALASPFAPISKFGFVKALRGRKDILESPERGRIMWRLVQSVKETESITSEQGLAFAELLSELGGRIETPGIVEFSHDELVAEDYEAPIENEGGIQRAILRHTLRLLKDQDREIVSSAFSTAKLILSVSDSKDHLKPPLFGRSLGPFVTFLSNPSLLRPQDLRQRQTRSLDELGRPEWIEQAEDHDQWIRNFAELVAEVRAESDGFYAQLVPLIKSSSRFASTIISNLVHSILLQALSSGDLDVELVISRYFEQLLRAKSTDSRTLSVIVKIASQLRRHPRTDSSITAASRFDRWLSVPWVLLADGAVKTRAYLDGLLFLELAHEYEGLFSTRTKQDQRTIEQAQTLLYEIYSKIEEPDGFYARESDDVRESLVSRYRHESRWTDAFRTYGARHETQSRSLGIVDRASTAGVVSSLSSFGFNRLAMSILHPAQLEGTLQDGDIPLDLPYELAWRTDVWDLPIERRAADTSSATLYSALQASRPGRPIAIAQDVVKSSLVSEIGKLSKVDLSLPSPDSKVVSTILALREAHNLVDLGHGDDISINRLKNLAQIPSDGSSFEQVELVLSTRISRLRSVRQQERLEAVGDAFDSPIYSIVRDQERACLIELSQAARQANRLQVALNSITTANTLVEDVQTIEVDRELAHVLWKHGEHTTAITLLNKVHERSGKRDPTIWATLGEWTGEARVRNPLQVLEDCFDPAIAALSSTTSPLDRARVYKSFAKFADQQYEELSRVTEEKRARFGAYHRRKALEFEAVNRSGTSNSGSNSLDSYQLKKHKEDAEGHLREDQQQLEESERTTMNMLRRALENYAFALTESDESNDEVFRFCGLWLAHADDEAVHSQIKPLLPAIPSHKFVFLSYQLSARLSLSARPSTSSKNIRRLVQRLCREHPFHAFFPVHALRDTPLQGKGSRRSSSVNAQKIDSAKSSRAQAAAEVIESVKSDEKVRGRIASLELACDAYGEWAAFDLKASSHYATGGVLKKGVQRILPSMRIKSKLKNQPIPVSTFDLPIDPTGVYPDSSFPSIVGYEDRFDTAGGIHLPKIVLCIGSDGERYRQLLKGDDDLRQDAVMEQIFVLVNKLLVQDVETRRRRLHIRTYKVIPLQNSHGLLEFVAKTSPLGSSLSQLYNDQPLLQSARNELGAIEKLKSRIDPETLKQQKLETFNKILQRIPPLMRHLFWKRQKVPSLWFDMRLNYSRSVATTSMIGHVLGLGDRHVSNILIDESTGELVHIDFGIAFEQGKRLPIPELVPFRLTQNLIDGFGSSGVDGVFRRCSEETLRVLRDRSNILMTILEVFKHDPLQRWAVSSDMAKRVQGSEDAEGIDELPDDADRALSIVRGKLDTRLSVQYSVNQVIQEATDPRNVSAIFCGWQPYL
ncbi:DNA-binding protein kinase TEL1 [Sporobolomyces salmoneus]|uniref:DNA-binding protein kinase TEL1 n=1 Tax=Sporobolomyces salmoneus TaxID=183962 RepID=UPI00316DFE66